MRWLRKNWGWKWMHLLRVLIVFLGAIFSCAPASSQTIQQSGPVTSGHASSWTTNGVLQDAGTSTLGYINSLGITGTGLPLCVSDTTVQTGPYYQFCLGLDDTLGASINYNAFGGAPSLPFSINVNGLSYQFPFSDIISVRDFGAKCNGTFDDTAAFVAAASSGLSFSTPSGTCVLSGGITLTGQGQMIFGAGRGTGGTDIKPSGNFNVFTWSGGSDGGGIRDVRIDAIGMTGGNILVDNGYNRWLAQNIVATNVQNFGLAEYSANSVFQNIYVSGVNGSYGIEFYGTDTTKGQVGILDNVTFGSGAAANCIVVDGHFSTLRASKVACNGMNRGLWVENDTGGSDVPSFLQLTDFETDTTTDENYRFDVGSQIYCTNCYSHAATLDGVYVASGVSWVNFTGLDMVGNFHNGFNILGQKVSILGSTIYTSSQAGQGDYDNILVGASAADITIDDNHWIGGTATYSSGGDPNYNINATSGALRVTFNGNKFGATHVADWADNSAIGFGNVQHYGNTGPTEQNYNPVLTVPFQSNAGATLTWTSMPLAATLFDGASRSITKSDLGPYTQARLIVEIGGTVCASGATLSLQYVTNVANILVAADYSTIGTAPVSVDCSVTANTVLDSGWINLVSGAQAANVYLNVIGAGGNGSTSPTINSTMAQFR